jgi:hypothetical protein
MPNLNEINPLQDNETELTEVEQIIENNCIYSTDAEILLDLEHFANATAKELRLTKEFMKGLIELLELSENGTAIIAKNNIIKFLKTK